ncbi:polyamine aminopropyltransferase [Allostreptomyces psammosilenae]|uniref:Polyamine aminopropyltransferase n=1 Tax=Allostreptomyces psammosilenae TaxID=1892865 RepID=A0A852ZUJ1_9ACTN|nr:polyamine aminopropyltransferase [Allostreptomyces psammosilenae]NYI05237.1 spermidine synthase [Allostreptomyces psammosilenae]
MTQEPEAPPPPDTGATPSGSPVPPTPRTPPPAAPSAPPGAVPSAPPTPAAEGPRPPGGPTTALRPGRARAVLLLAAFLCAACGLVYELALVALGSYLIGDSVTQASVVLSVMVFAMGVGSLLAKRFTSRAAAAFAVVELLLGLVGGLSVAALYACFVWLDAYRPALVACAFVVGTLIGAEMPLIMALLERLRQQALCRTVADVFAADYVGGLIGGLAFPFLLLPVLGQLAGAIVVGGVNALAGAVVVLWLFRADLGRRPRALLWSGLLATLAVLAVSWSLTGHFEAAARRALYPGAVLHAERSEYQQVTLVASAPPGGPADSGGTPASPSGVVLLLDGTPVLDSADERRLHEAMVHPALAGPRSRVLILGGGDGMALREVLRYPDVTEVTLVEVDPAVTRLAATHPALTALNRHAYDDPRVEVVHADAFGWLRDRARGGGAGGGADAPGYDVALCDLPPPSVDDAAKLYTVEFYGMLGSVLAPDGRIAVRTGALDASAAAGRADLWRITATLEATGLHTTPYRPPAPATAPTPDGTPPDGGTPQGRPADPGIVLAGREPPPLRLPADAPPLRHLDASLPRGGGELGASRPAALPPPATLPHPEGDPHWDG